MELPNACQHLLDLLRAMIFLNHPFLFLRQLGYKAIPTALIGKPVKLFQV